MSNVRSANVSRRRFLETTVQTTFGVVVTAAALPRGAAAERQPAKTGATRLKPTPSCGAHGPTQSQTAGPFYTPNTPERASLLERGITGTRLVLTGRVFTTDCQPIAGALLDFWQADDGGEYDNDGFRLRGHQFADASGRYRLETVMPGLYPGRTRHIHVRVKGDQQPLLTTQLYFPQERLNRRDGIFHPSLVVELQNGKDSGQSATFDFVLG